MNMARTPLMAGNWKMNLNHVEATGLVQKLAWTLADAKYDPSVSEAAVIVPFTSTSRTRRPWLRATSRRPPGAQDTWCTPLAPTPVRSRPTCWPSSTAATWWSVTRASRVPRRDRSVDRREGQGRLRGWHDPDHLLR